MAGWTDGTRSMRNHYGDSSDEPSWTETSDTANSVVDSWARNIEGINGDLAATQNSDGTVTLYLGNLHGDIVATMANDPGVTAPASTSDSDEYGNPYSDTTTYSTYGWLGAKRRSRDALGGVTPDGGAVVSATTRPLPLR